MPMDTIERIKLLMRSRGWSEYRLAKESGLSQSTIANIFRRNTLPSIPTLEIICKAFNITLSQFFSDEDRNISLSPEQSNLLNNWGKISEKKRKALLALIEEIAE